MMSRSRPWFDFGAGLLIGAAITVALFAAMEESEGRLSQHMLLVALAALAAASVLKFAARDRRSRRRVGSARYRAPGHPADIGWTVESARPAGAPGRADRGNKTARDERTSKAPAAVSAPLDTQMPAAERDTRRL